MDDRETSVASSSDFYGSDPKSNTTSGNALQAPLPTKRKAEEAEVIPEKKQKLDTPSSLSTTDLLPCAGLPPAIWQHIFLFCPLETLGRLLQVNRSFHSYLTEVRDVPILSSDSGSLRLLKSESIWASARNMHPTKPPKPLPGFTEAQMWRLAWSKTCQFCQKLDAFTPGEKIWQRGPGTTGVRAVWPFGIRACGSCLLERCQTDASLLFSSASALRPALPFALITGDANYIPAYTLQAATTPANVEISKYYYKPHVAELTKELERALSLGTAAAEEWYKGLESRGKDRMKYTENWERWEVKYQWWEKHQGIKTAHTTTSSTSATSQRRQSPCQPHESPTIYAPVPASRYLSTPSVLREKLAHDAGGGIQHAAPPLTAAATTTPHPSASQPYAQPLANTNTPFQVSGVGAQVPRGERNLHDAIEAKANRKLEIERRAMLLDPPIPPNILRHMESFKAAIQISQPLNDYAWSMLQPRLLAQLPEAQQAEAEHFSRLASVTARAADRRLQDPSSKELKEVLDREWEELQKPVRDKLNALADEFINQDWDHGRAVTYENSPKFAADLLLNVRRRYYAEVGNGTIPSTIQNLESGRVRDTPGTKLVLENMKWVYDNKLKPLTEQFRKELFLCYGNGCEGNPRFYGFEGVIQHFAAKHTNAFSRGNIVVAWREAEWPEEAPFHPDPISVKHAHHYGLHYPGYGRAGTVTPLTQSHPPQASPSPYVYGNPGPFAPPSQGIQAGSGYDYAQGFAGPKETHFHQSMGPPVFGTSANLQGRLASPTLGSRAEVPSTCPQPTAQVGVARTNDQGSQNISAGRRDITIEAHQKHVSTIAEAAQEAWRQTSGIQDIPSGLRVYVLLHHIISRFRFEFHDEPTWSRVLDAFSSPEMSSTLKYAPGLMCKACQILAPPRRFDEGPTYTTLDLLRHFESKHMAYRDQGRGSSQATVPLDWKEDMIVLPDDRFISDLIHNPRMDSRSLHLFATVFPKRFPTPLSKVQTADENGMPPYPLPHNGRNFSPLPGYLVSSLDKSAPSSLDSRFTDSPRPPKPSEDEYDPLHPALVTTTRPLNPVRRREPRRESPLQPGPRREGEYIYVGGHGGYSVPAAANELPDQRTQPPMEGEYGGNLQFTSQDQVGQGHGPAIGEHPARYAMHRGYEDFQDARRKDVVYARPPDEDRFQEYPMHSQGIYQEYDHDSRAVYRPRGPTIRERSHGREPYEADQFHEATGAIETSSLGAAGQDLHPSELQNRLQLRPVPDYERGVSPRPINRDESRSHDLGHRKALSAASNGSDQEERHHGVQGSSGLSGTQRRNDRHGYVPARYYRYMKVVRDDPYGRGPSSARSQNKRYERYAEQQRRFEQQEPLLVSAGGERILENPRNPSIDRVYPEEPYTGPFRQGSREHVPRDDHGPPRSPPGHRYATSPESHRGPPPVYYDQYGRPLYEYEIIHVADDPGLRHSSYPSERYYVERDTDQPQYIAWDVPPPRHQSRGHEYVYYEDRGPSAAGRPVPQSHRGAVVYEPMPPEIKVEGGPAAMPENGP